MKKFLQQLGVLGGGGDAATLEEARRKAGKTGKPILVDLFVPF